ncbi:fibronectin type III domain-containing protein [Pedobacter sp.]|uniref:fibronectin type III domain-containing protein n=1 Tax=Pedobacter sp. TaxID=1411316 RepID=UPI003BA92BA9
MTKHQTLRIPLCIKFLLYLFCLFSVARAQVYPVQVTPVLVPPYPLHMNEYYGGTTERFAVVLTNTDLQKPLLEVRLRLYIEGQQLKLKSSEGGDYPTINLDAGVPQRISLGDLAPYFHPDNLDFSGWDRAGYIRDGRLPEGMYSFCFEAIAAHTGQLLSRKSCTMAYLALNDPPLLNLPGKAERVAAGEVQNIPFQWTPRNMGSPSAAFNTRYEFTLKELWDTEIAPEAGFESSPVLYQASVSTTTLLLGPAEPQLVPGKRYAWRVRAISSSPTGEQTDSYRNHGFSEIYWFDYQNDCKPPAAINAGVTGTQAILKWEDPTGASPAGGYTLQYREAALTGGNWYRISTLEKTAQLRGLKPGQVYEYRIGSVCSTAGYVAGADNASYSPILNFETAADPGGTTTINCGMIAPEISIANKNPIPSLSAGELFTTGKFPVRLTKVTGSRSFSGEGYLTIPMLGQVNVKVRFKGIGINTDRQLYDGVVETGYEEGEAQVADVKEIYDDLKTLVAEITSLVKKRTDYLEHYSGTERDKKEALEREKEENEAYAALAGSPYLTAQEKAELKAEQAEKSAGYSGLAGEKDCGGNTIVPKKGPGHDFADVDCYTQKIAGATKLKSYAEKARGRERQANEKEQRELASSWVINIGAKPTDKENVAAFATPDGSAIYLDREQITRYTAHTVTGALTGFKLRSGESYSYDSGTKSYKSPGGEAFQPVRVPGEGTLEVLLFEKLGCEVRLYAVNVSYPNTPSILPERSAGKLKEQFSVGCLEGFFKEQGREYVSRLEKLLKIAEFFKKCAREKWAAYDGGIVPYCFWKNSNTAPALYYSALDVPFRVGMIDGAYGQVKGLVELSEKLSEITYAYTIGSLDCEGLLDNVKEYGELQAEINKLSKEEAIEKQVQKAFAEFKARRLEAHTRDCLANKKIITETEETIKALWELVENEEKLEQSIASIGERLKEYLSKLADTTELARYKQGKLVIDVASMFIGAGEVNGARKIITFEKYLAKAGKADVEKVVAELGERGKKVEGIGDEVVDGADDLVKKIPDEVLAEIDRIKELSKDQRIKELGLDPVKGQLDLYEGEIGQLIESEYGFFKRFTTSAEGDFVSMSGENKGKSFDVFGLPKHVARFENYDIAKFFPSIDKHFLNKPNIDFLVLDMRYMNVSQKTKVNEYINKKFHNSLFKLIKVE